MIILTWRGDIFSLMQWLILGFETEFTDDLWEELKEGFKTTVSVHPSEVLTSMCFSTYYLAPGSQSHSFLDSSAGPDSCCSHICLRHWLLYWNKQSIIYSHACDYIKKSHELCFIIQKTIVSENISFFKLSSSTLPPTSKQVKE